MGSGWQTKPAGEDGQRLVEATFDAIPDIIGVQDLDHRIVRYNTAGYNFLELTPEEVRGRRCYELMGWGAPCARCATSIAIQRREPSLIEKYVAELGVWLEVRAYPVMDDAEKITLVIEHLRDITDRKLAEQALKESEERYSLLAERANDAIVVLQEGTFVFVNKAWERLVGYGLDELRDLPLGAALVPEERETVVALYKARLAGKQPPSVYETRLLHKNGHEVEVEISAALFEYRGKPADLAVVRDISDRKTAERERRKLEEQIQCAQRLESLGVLAGGIAHDFNNLLVGVLGNATLALEDLPSDAPARESVEAIEVAGTRAAELVAQMLAYAGKGTVEPRVLDLTPVAQEMVKLLESSIDKKARLRLELAAGLPAVRVDPAQLRQVVMNLVTNASDALGGEAGEIVLSTGMMDHNDEGLQRGACLPGAPPQGRCCYVRVSDTGGGMDGATLGKIFEPFFSTKFAGRGLGLAATLGIVRRHRGAIHVESAPGRTVFTVLLPAWTGAEEEAEETDGARGEHWRGAGKVLLVDDEPLVATVGRRMLERLGFEVQVASNGRVALDAFAAAPETFTLVLLDLSMPVMNGTECLNEIRKIKPDATIVFSSGYSAEEATACFSGLGLAGFIQKPYRYGALAARLEAILGRRRD
jgi:PAS domain S-box-containing protein